MTDRSTIDRTTAAEAHFQEVLSRAAAKDRSNIEKHLIALDAEAEPNHGALWRRLTATLGTLAPLPVQTLGGQHVLFFIPDGKYRMQVFALEDQRDGFLRLYLPDVASQAVRQKLLSKSGDRYTARASKGAFAVHPLEAANTPDPLPHFKNMIGWNRKALRVILDASQSDGPDVKLVESLCTLASKQWAGRTPR